MQNQEPAFVTAKASMKFPGERFQQIQSVPPALTIDGGAPSGYEMPDIARIHRLPLYYREVVTWEPEAVKAPCCFRPLRLSRLTCWILAGVPIVILMALVFSLPGSEIANPVQLMSFSKLDPIVKWTAKHKAMFGISIASIVHIFWGAVIAFDALCRKAVGRLKDELIAYTVEREVWRYADEKQLADYREMGTIIAAHPTEINKLLGVNHNIHPEVIAQRTYEQEVLQSRGADGTSHTQYGRKINLRRTTTSSAPYPNPAALQLSRLWQLFHRHPSISARDPNPAALLLSRLWRFFHRLPSSSTPFPSRITPPVEAMPSSSGLSKLWQSLRQLWHRAAPESSVPSPNDLELGILPRYHTDSTRNHHTESEEVPICGICGLFDCLRCGRRRQERVSESYRKWDKPVAMRILMNAEWAKAEEKRWLHIECKIKAKHMYGKWWRFKIMNRLDWLALWGILLMMAAAIGMVLMACYMKD